MKPICQRGFNCPYSGRDEGGGLLCTYPHIYLWKHPYLRLIILDDNANFEIEALRGYDWTDIYSYVDVSDCPLVDPGSELDPVMQYTDEDSP